MPGAAADHNPALRVACKPLAEGRGGQEMERGVRRVTGWEPMPIQQHRDLFEQRVSALTDAEVLEIFAHTVREATPTCGGYPAVR
jgi:hypothetical protein